MTLDEYLTLHPTPWTVHPCGCKDECWCRVIKSSGEVEDWLVGDGCINEVQANLLAAAPEMLTLLEFLGAYCDEGSITAKQIRDVIAKARGASHE